jgi:hypothetical protein
MRVPQVSDRVKEAPAQVLRGVFAGIGQLLLITDKLRNKTPAGQQVRPARPAGPDTDAGLPLPNYDELSIASLRARLRNLNVTQLRQLAGYEQAHAARAEVLTMFERRIAKLGAEARAEADEEAEVEAREEVAGGARAEVAAEAEDEA